MKAKLKKRLSWPITGSQSELETSHMTMRVERFDSDVFRQLMEFAHTGRIDLQPRTITGVICAADYYQLTDLMEGGLEFFPMCLKVIGI